MGLPWWLIHANVWQKPLQYCKVISLQLIKINEKKVKIKTIENFLKKKKKESALQCGRHGFDPGLGNY